MRPKEFHFPLAVDWTSGRRVAVSVAGKHDVEIAPPLEFFTNPKSERTKEFLSQIIR
jgi:hypothetical protein